MTDAEKLAHLQDAQNFIDQAVDILEAQRSDPRVTVDRANQITFQIGALQKARDRLTLASLDVTLVRMEASAHQLDDIATQIDKASDALKSIAVKIDTAAKIIGIAASIAAKVATA